MLFKFIKITALITFICVRILGMLKHPSLLLNGHDTDNGQSKVAVDCCERAFELSKMINQPVRDSIFTLYPRIYALHNLSSDEGYPLYDEDEYDELAPVVVPRWLKCSAELIDSGGIYLLDDGAVLWLYIGRCVKQSVIKDLMGLSASHGNPPSTNVKPAAYNAHTTSSSSSSSSIGKCLRRINSTGTNGSSSSASSNSSSSSSESVSSVGDISRCSYANSEKNDNHHASLPPKNPPNSPQKEASLHTLSSFVGGTNSSERMKRHSSRTSCTSGYSNNTMIYDRDINHSTSPYFVGLKPLLNVESDFAQRVSRIVDTIRESHTQKPG
jgi:hypothetical protein